MRLRGLGLACGLAAAWSSRAHAEPPPVEVGGFVGFDLFPRSVELGNSWAADQVPGSAPTVGARAAWWLVPALWRGDGLALHLGVEGEAQVALSSTSSDAMAGRASYAAPVVGGGAHLIALLETGTAVMPHVVVGGGANLLLTHSPFAANDLDPVGYWGLGASWRLGDRLLMRVDLRHGVEAGRNHDVVSTFSANLGVAMTFGGGARRPTLEHVATTAPARPDDHAPTTTTIKATTTAPPAPSDRDGDGIADDRDQCPDAREDVDGYQDDDGCPDPDNDGDGIADARDQCPNQPELYNGIADDDGCPDQLPAALTAALERGPSLGFDAGKARLRPAANKDLDQLASLLRASPGVRIAVIGHAGKGVKDDLARRRAEAVKWYLVDAGIAADRLDTRAAPADGGAARIELATAPVPPPATP